MAWLIDWLCWFLLVPTSKCQAFSIRCSYGCFQSEQLRLLWSNLSQHFFLYIVYRLGRRIQRCRCRLQPDTNGYHFFSPLRFMWNSGTIAGALQWPSDCILRHCSDLLHAPLHHFYSDCWCHDLSIQILWSTDWTVLCCWSVGLSQNVCLRRFCEVVLDSHSMEKSFWRIRIVRTLQSCAACLSRI